jgi:hypothetical protein
MSDEAAHWVLGSGGPGCVSPRGDGSLGDEQMCRWSRRHLERDKAVEPREGLCGRSGAMTGVGWRRNLG